MNSYRIAMILVLCSAALAQGQPTQPTEPARTGTFETKFTERSPLSAPAPLAKRLGLAKAEANYDLSTFEFIVHVPENYDPTKPMGVMYLLLYKDTSDPPRPCLPLFDELGLIFVVAKLKDPPEAVRCGQMLDVIHNLKKRYKIDESRMYLFAMWGGDKEHSNHRIGLTGGDVFSGIFFNGVTFYRDVPSKDGSTWKADFSAPPAASMAATKRRGIILDHENANDRGWPYLLKGFESDGFKYVVRTSAGREDLHYPNFSPDFLRKCFDFFDASTAKAAAIASQPPPKETAPTASKPSTSKPAVPAPPTVSEPARMLKLAKSYIAAGSYTQARTRLKTIIEKHPTSPEAAKAKALLKEIESK